VRKVLLDENLPRDLAAALPEFEVWTVGRAGWGGIKNGELLRRASAEFDVFVTADKRTLINRTSRSSISDSC